MSFLTTLGLRALPPNASSPRNLAAPFLFANWLWAHALLSTRTPKQYLGIDNNVSPREDLEKHGANLPSRTLAMLKRWEAAHANSMEGYAFFATAVLLALHAGVQKGRLNGCMAAYSVARLAYAGCYIFIEDSRWSQLRGCCFWAGNLACTALLWEAGRKL